MNTNIKPAAAAHDGGLPRHVTAIGRDLEECRFRVERGDKDGALVEIDILRRRHHKVPHDLLVEIEGLLKADSVRDAERLIDGWSFQQGGSQSITYNQAMKGAKS